MSLSSAELLKQIEQSDSLKECEKGLDSPIDYSNAASSTNYVVIELVAGSHDEALSIFSQLQCGLLQMLIEELQEKDILVDIVMSDDGLRNNIVTLEVHEKA